MQVPRESGDLTAQRRDQTMFRFSVQIATADSQNGVQYRVGRPIDYGTRSQVQIGGIYANSPQTIEQPLENTGQTDYSLDDALYFALESLFRYNAARGFGPTICARIHYLFFATVAAAWAWAAPTTRLTGVRDGWDWSRHFPVGDEASQLVWFTLALNYAMPRLVPTFDTSVFQLKAQEGLGLDADGWSAAAARVKAAGAWDAWTAACDAWWAARATDGATAAVATQPTAAQLPNGTTTLDVSTTQDIAAYPDPNGWTPLTVGGSRRGYLTYNWGDVRSPALAAGDETTIKAAAAATYPTALARTVELGTLLTLVTSLTDQQKVIAEFWAGGPNTITPPGMGLWLWKEYTTAARTGRSRGFETLFLSGLELAIGLFDGSRITWALKKQFMQARPIQEIRRRYAATSMTKYDGTTILGASWVPYQMPNFVTPPFPDFPSGHSTFSQVFANVMTAWFGATIAPAPIRVLADLQLLSPIFKTTQEGAVGTYTISTGSSEIQPGVVPAAPVVLEFSTWQSMADSAGVSRQYGGIHCVSAHTGGVAVANGVTSAVRAAWGF